MHLYLDLMRHVLQYGHKKSDRTGTGTLSVFGYQMRFDLHQGFPLVTTKKCHVKSIIHELLWFLRGDTNIGYLKENGVSIWDEWADEQKSGAGLRTSMAFWTTSDGRSIDQITRIIQQIRETPDSRRMIVSAWNTGILTKWHLPLSCPVSVLCSG